MRRNTLVFLTQGLRVITLVVAIVIFILNVFFCVTVSYDSQESVTIQPAFQTGIISLVLIAAFFLGLIFLRKDLEKLDEKKLFLSFSIIYCIAAGYFILNLDMILRGDAKIVADTAMELHLGDLESFRSGYLNRYPHQIGLVLYDALLDFYTQNHAIQFVMNLIFVLGTNYTLYLTSNLLFKDHFTTVLTIILSFFFLPQLFFILFAYGNIPSFFFLLLAFYNLLKYRSTHSLKTMLVIFLSASVAVFLRKNTMIGVIAMIIFLLLDALKRYTNRHLILIVLLIVGTIFPSNIAYSYFAQKAGTEKAGIPTVLWIAMGTDINNSVLGPGWYNRFSVSVYEDVGKESDLAHAIGVQKLKENWSNIRKEPGRAIAFFRDKTISQWCDPLYQSVWSGPLKEYDQMVHTCLLESLYNCGIAERFAVFFCRIFAIAIWGFAVLFLLKDSSETTGWELAFMFMIGGFLFQCFWEAKSQYIYQYVLGLVPFGAYSLSNGIKKMSSALLRKRNR